MAATVQINQRYGTSPGTQNDSVTRHDWLSASVSQLTDVRAANPLTKPGAGTTYSFETYNRLDMTALGGSTKIQNFRTYCSSSPPTGYTTYTNQYSTTPPNETYHTPVGGSASTYATRTPIPTTDPAAKCLEPTELTSAGQSSYLITQLWVGTSATGGWDHTNQFFWVYEEIA